MKTTMNQSLGTAESPLGAGRTYVRAPWYKRQKTRDIVRAIIVYSLVLPGAVLFIIPLVWMLSTALKPSNQIFVYPPQWIPDPPRWQNFIEGWTAYLPFNTMMRNSAIITLNNIVGNVFSCSLAAYGFARLRARGKNVLFGLVLATMLLPNEVTIIPQYVLFTNLLEIIKPYWPQGGVLWFLYRSWIPLTVPAWFGWPFFIFLLRQFFMSIPIELDEAARIDGASSWRILFQIIIPLAKPALATVVIFSFIGNWNNFLGPLIYIRRIKEQVLAVGLNMFRGQYGQIQFHYMMAVALIVLLPVLIVFFFGQRLFVQGIALSGIKG
ncbi:MAG: carbohydrate ABC transporter permease [Caldilineae bacterium]|nr:MAG: carbohydrate ABC transporter permease [Caldilineae bacterium]